VKKTLAFALLLLLAVPAVRAEDAQGRTLEDLKAEAIARADRNAYPLIGLKPADVREAMGRLKTLERDEWAASWSAIGDRYMKEKDFHQAWLVYSFARWPVPNSPGKQRAYEKALEAWLAHAKRFDPPVEMLKVPFEGKEVVGYLQIPRVSAGGAKPVPLIVAISGLDSRKEEMVERFAPLVARGIAVLALDSPGTGESPVKAAPGAERTLVAALDAVLKRPDVDPQRVAVYGGSFGGYWATILAASEKQRVRAVVAQSPPIHETYSAEHTRALATNREYLFDYLPASLFTHGAKTLDELIVTREQMSLRTRGILAKPMAPMLVIGGRLDTQVPIADIELLLLSGETPKDAWIHPGGGHMGRDRKDWPDPVIFRRVTAPWLTRALTSD